MTSSVVLCAIRSCRRSVRVLNVVPSTPRSSTNSVLVSRIRAHGLRTALPSSHSWASLTPFPLKYDHRLSHVNKPHICNSPPAIFTRTLNNDYGQNLSSAPLIAMSTSSSADDPGDKPSPLPARRNFSGFTKRVTYTGRLGAGIEKKRTRRVRNFVSEPPSASAPRDVNGKSVSTPDKAEKNSKGVTWREALKSPRKAIAYVGQLRRDLVDWAKHMWAGAKLLAADVRVSYKILKRVTSGKQITRRERNFIVQTGVDLARLVPFSLFLIIPLAEFALPFALRLFPNMLPSQFQDQMKEAEDLKRRLKARLELAKYLREVVEEKAKLVKASDANSELKKNAEDLTEFLDAIRSGKDVTGASVSRFAKFFNDELTIDGAGRPQLVAMCKFLGISPYGHDIFLRFKLRSRLNAIKKDDMQIMWEGGVDSLTDSEVAKACRDRGIREEVSKTWMRKQLSDWLELSQKREIPGSLLIMSRAVLYSRTDGRAESGEDGLVETMGSMPDDVIMDVKQAADVGEGTTVERLEETLRQAKLIEIESERAARKEKEDEAKRKKREVEEEEALGKVAEEAQAIVDKQGLEKAAAIEEELRKEVFDARTEDASSFSSESRKESEAHELKEDKDAKENLGDVEEEQEAEVSQRDEEEAEQERDRMRKMLESLGQLSSDSSVKKEREELHDLKLQLAEAERLAEGTEAESSSDMRRFKNMVSKLEREIERVDTKIGLRMKLLDKDNDGVMSLGECKSAMTVIAGKKEDDIIDDLLQRLDADDDGNISKADLARLLHDMQFEYGVVDEPASRSTNSATSGDEK